jgi:hypothetical protein
MPYKQGMRERVSESHGQLGTSFVNLSDEAIAQIVQLVASRLQTASTASPAVLRDKLGLMRREEFAAATGRTVRALKRDALRRVGPPPVLIGKRVFYRVSDIEDYLQAQARRQGVKNRS